MVALMEFQEYFKDIGGIGKATYIQEGNPRISKNLGKGAYTLEKRLLKTP